MSNKKLDYDRFVYWQFSFEMTIKMIWIYLKIPNSFGVLQYIFTEKGTPHEILNKITSFISRKKTAVMLISF